MRRGAAQRPPRFGQRRHLLCGRPRLQAEPDSDGFLHGEIARRPGVAMPQAKQQINVGGPRADTGQRRQRMVRGVGILIR